MSSSVSGGSVRIDPREMPAAASGPAGSPRAVRSPIRRALGNLGWPILQKELRADFRKNRFFFTHLICLSALAGAILWKVAVHAENRDLKPEEIGRDIFNTFFWIQYLVVMVVFPAFSANALSEERSAGTFDLLVTSDLRPEEIVWGKFLASSVYCLIYIVATVPLLSISLLFAGVTLGEIGAAYLILLALTALVAMTGVFVSSCFSSNIRATITLYLLTFGATAWSWFYWASLLAGKEATAMRALGEKLFPEGSRIHPLAWLPTVVGLLGLGGVLFSYLFLFASNRIRPRAFDRTSRLRLLTFVVFLAALGWTILGDSTRSGGPLSRGQGVDSFETLLFWTALGLLSVGILFTAEPADVPLRLRRQFSRLRGVRFPLRIFAPGPFWGLLYTAVLAVISCGALALYWFALSGGGPLDRAYRECLITLPLYIFAFAGLGFFLSSLDFSPLYGILTVTFVFIITLLLPVIFQIGGHSDGFLSLYYLSPITLWYSLHPDLALPEGPRYVLLEIPIIHVAQFLFALLGSLFTTLGIRRSRMRGYPLLSFLPSPEAE